MAYFDEAIQFMKQQNYEEAIAKFTKGSEEGDYKCSFQLANIYNIGNIAPFNLEKSTTYFDKTKEQLEGLNETGDVNYIRGIIYFFGLGTTKQDKVTGIEFIKKAAELNNVDAKLLLINCYRVGDTVDKDEDKAFELLKGVVDLGHPGALRMYGDCFYFGKGVEQNYEEAFKYYKQASDKGDIRALFTVGTCYYEGRGVEKDDKIAFGHFLKAALAGYPDGMRNVAYFYNQGIGIEKDLKKEVEWLEKLATRGDVNGMYALARCYLGREHSLFKYKEGIQLLKRGAQVGDVKALMMLGRIYEFGQYGTLPHPQIAFSSYNTAYSKGYKPAAIDLKRCYENGIGTQRNPSMAKSFDSVIEKLNKSQERHDA